MKRLTDQERRKKVIAVQKYCDSKEWLSLNRMTPRYKLSVMIPDDVPHGTNPPSEEVINIIKQFKYTTVKQNGYSNLITDFYTISYIYNKIFSK